jgi:hypothetical protein
MTRRAIQMLLRLFAVVPGVRTSAQQVASEAAGLSIFLLPFWRSKTAFGNPVDAFNSMRRLEGLRAGRGAAHFRPDATVFVP